MLCLTPRPQTVVELGNGGSRIKAGRRPFFKVLDRTAALGGIESQLNKQRLGLGDLCFRHAAIRFGDKSQQGERGLKKLCAHDVHGFGPGKLQRAP